VCWMSLDLVVKTMIEQRELIHYIQQYLPVKHYTRLINTNWNNAFTEDDQDTWWKQRLIALKQNVISESYLIQRYEFSNNNYFLQRHYFGEWNYERSYLTYKERKLLAENVVCKWLEQHTNEHTTGEYEKFSIVVTQLNQLREQMPTETGADTLLLFPYRVECVLFGLFVGSIIVFIANVLLAILHIYGITIQYIHGIILSIMVIICILSFVCSLFQYIILYFGKLMIKLEYNNRIAILALLSIHCLVIIIYYHLFTRVIDHTGLYYCILGTCILFCHLEHFLQKITCTSIAIHLFSKSKISTWKLYIELYTSSFDELVEFCCCLSLIYTKEIIVIIVTILVGYSISWIWLRLTMKILFFCRQ
jgi:hypothetical protein